jgi:hypothetical protein
MRAELVQEAKRLYALGWYTVKASTELIYQAAVLYKKIKGSDPCCIDTVLQPWFMDEVPIIINNDSILNQKQQMKTNNFKLKDSATLYVESLNDYITNANLTDENAVAYLKEKPHGVSNFEKVPEDLAGFIQNFNSTSDAGASSNSAGSASVSLDKLTKDALVQLAVDHDFPEEEYKDMNKKDLIAYLRSKVKQ